MVSTERGSPTDRATSHSVRARSGIAHRSAQSENRTTVASVPAFTTADSRAGEAWTTFLAIEEVAGRSVDDTVMEPVRNAVAAIFGVVSIRRAATEDSAVEDPRVAACVDFAEQFVVDVSGMTDDQRGAMTSAMGADAFLFVQTLFVTDVFTRGRIAIARLFADSAVHALSGVGSTKIAPGDDAVDLWALLERFMQQVALLDALDPLTTELIRLRGARIHNCRLCQSRRSVKAMDSAGVERAGIFDAIDDYELADLDVRHIVALRLTDALVTQPGLIDEALSADVHRLFSDAETVEILFDVIRNAANKIAVAFGADAPIVVDGVEFYDIDAHGDVVANVDVMVVRNAMAG